ncbi:MAG: GNAT family N-acetyltransferase [Cyclobacteriaceae bacterium]
MKLEIKAISVDDLLTILNFAREQFINTYQHLNEPDNFKAYIDRAFTLHQFTREFNHPDSTFYQALLDQNLVGYYKLNTKDAQTEPNHHNAAEIERIYVAPSHKGLGIGKAMIDHALNQASTCEYLWLGVWEKNKSAIAFYQKMGFQAFGKHIFQVGNDPQTDIMMKRIIFQP